MGKTHSPEQKAGRAESVTQPDKISILARLLLLPIYFYRYAISPLIGPRCRFYPTCSTYAVEAIKIHGAIKGGYLAFKRILRCNPLSEGGEDPVPPCCKGNCKHNDKK
ncbi:Putative membrane protein insertion efficiency factor [Mannheimia haemolytica]|uniref:Putative membrane protein insertion efficiency factor n=1 Tax=Mannheimia haemolytica TaxID=75985 RepID=A0A1D2Q7J4_MANHA|nr:membrane protein insertion efficiency factor YidD [Mannheimia haemolytica]MDW0616100.1 membrane protein insertion efficiency factor YidD [Mannheimia haemolytica]MEE3700596.1 membrane protein insertion efficiency factor YidD [Mannheimia haemolytica]ODQ39093.1 membrane protein insertion efficiency factor YidD [Mannheimia haemolytica]UQX67357.1 membrane protein insertion efficiency factor YidD [Mannheimia haemolytica]STY62387.1 Putative membrane protein insertion efficiency factor [Mannheimia 